MIRTPAERQAWNDTQAARFAQPDEVIQIINGREWARVRPMYCANCGNLFYGWTPLDVPLPSYVKDEGRGKRLTCNHPMCEKAETERDQRTAH